MIVVHHLNESRSQRILWLLEELGAAYEIRHYQRDQTTRLAPPELRAVHPLGKSPVIQVDGATLIESGAIVDYLLRHHGGAALRPAADSADFELYQQWLHYAEGSAMLPLLLKLYVSRLGDAGAPLKPRIDSELANHLGYVDRALARPRLARRQCLQRRRRADELCRRSGARPARELREPGRLGAALPGAPGVPARTRARRALLDGRLIRHYMAMRNAAAIGPSRENGT